MWPAIDGVGLPLCQRDTPLTLTRLPVPLTPLGLIGGNDSAHGSDAQVYKGDDDRLEVRKNS